MPLGVRPSGTPDDRPPRRAADLERLALSLLRSLDETSEDAPPLPLDRATAIDFHVHVIDPSRNVVSLARLAHRTWGRLYDALPVAGPSFAHDLAGRLVERAATLGPRAVFALYPVYRRLPRSAREVLETAAAPTLIAHAVARGYKDLLLEDMRRANVSHAVVIGMDVLASTDYVLDLCAQDSRLFGVVVVPETEPDVRGAVRRAKQKGAIGVKVHACVGGFDPCGDYANTLIDAAADEGLITVIHTGRARIGLYKAQEGGDPRAFVEHFQRHKDATFVLAHMNMAEPELALDVARRHENVYVDTSWQEARDVRRAVARIGADRILAASDWPFGPDVIARARRAVEDASLPSSVRELILIRNARRLIRGARERATAAPS